MNIVLRNYYRILRNDAFGENEPLEPMSEHKWRKVRRMAQNDGVTQYIGSIPDSGSRQQATPASAEASAVAVSSTALLSVDGRRVRRLMERERHSMDTSVESLELLNIIMHNTDETLNRHASLRMIIEMGVFLRKKGDRVDFIKTERWLRKLGVRRLAELHGSVLIAMFNFNLNEIPFMHRYAKCAKKFIVCDRCLTLGYLFKYPGATVHSWFRAIHNVLTQIEE